MVWAGVESEVIPLRRLFFLQLASPVITSTTSGATCWNKLIWRTSHCGK
jgi:hypothetical protein